MNAQAAFTVWEAYFHGELTAEVAAERLADMHDQVEAYSFELPDVPDAVERAEQLTVALAVALQRRNS